MASRSPIDISQNELSPPETTVTAASMDQLLPSAPQLQSPLPSPLRRPSLIDFTSHLTTQHASPVLPQVHKNNFENQSITPNVWSPANAICHPTEPSQGYGRLRHLDRMKREQYMLNAHEPLVVKWDMVDLTSIIDVLEACGNGPPRARNNTRANGQDRSSAPVAVPAGGNFSTNNLHGPQLEQQQSRFDPRAPHFDVILLDLTNAPADLYQSTEEGVEKYTATPDSSPESNLKPKKGRLNSFLGFKDHRNPSVGEFLHATVKKVSNASKVRKDINELPMESLAGRPGWLFLWVGTTENMVEGRRILGRFGFRKVECIGWMKTTNGGWKNIGEPLPYDDSQHSTKPTGMGVLRRGVEWCLVGVKGTAKRTYDSHLIHCNVNTDVIICDGSETPKSSLLSKIIENFSQGQRRLHIFANPGDERPGWVCVGKDFEETTFDCKKYMKFWEDKGKHGWLMPFDPEIEYFRPKTPPLQVRKRERAGLKRGGNHGNRWEDDLPKFPHLGQRKRPVIRHIFPEDPKYTKKATTITNEQRPPVPAYMNGSKPAMGSRVTQLSGNTPGVRSNNQNSQNPHNQPRNFQYRRASEPLLKASGLAKEFQPSPTAKHFHPKNLTQDPEPILRPKSVDIQPQSSYASGTPMGNSYEYPCPPNGQPQEILPEDTSTPSISSTSPPEVVYQQYPQQYQYPKAPSSYPNTNPSSLSSQFGALSMYSGSRQSESPPPYNSPSDYSPRNFSPVNFPLGGPGRIRTANAARLANFPPVFRTEYRQSQRQPALLSGYYGTLNSEAVTNSEYNPPQRPFDKPGGYGSLSNVKPGSKTIASSGTPEQYHAPHYQQFTAHSAPFENQLNQGPPHQGLQDIQYGGYPSEYRQPHQYQQLQQIPNTLYQEPFHQQVLQNQQPQFDQYGAYGFQSQQPQNTMQNPWLPEYQVDYESQRVMTGTQGPVTFL